MRQILAVGVASLLFLSSACGSPGGAGNAPSSPSANAPAGLHVLLISVDGLHQADLAWYVTHRPQSALAALIRSGTDYTQASTPFPSDSFPGTVAQVTGGNPASTGIYYDNSYSRALLPAGTSSCPNGAPTGADVEFDETIDRNPKALDAGQGLDRLPDNIPRMTGQPQGLIDPAKLPVDPKTCTPVFPHQYLQVNTIFEVARAHNLRTAWSDKHPAYDLLNGPSGGGVQDLFTPEINSEDLPPTADADWTTDNLKTQEYDSRKVQAVVNELDGYDHSRTVTTGVPAIFGINFQSVSTAQKLPTSDGQAGGYGPDGVTPGPLLSNALDFVDRQIATFTREIDSQHLSDSTTIILSAKHGQSPMNPSTLTRIDDGALLDGLNAAWTAAHPGGGKLVAHSTADDGMLLWLTDHSQAAADFARTYLLAQSGAGNDITGKPRPFSSSGLSTVDAGQAAAAYFHAAPGDARVPDIVGIAKNGTVFTGGKSKIAEHGGAGAQDRNVPILISGPGVEHGRSNPTPVETTQIAPTVLTVLGLNPSELQAVTREHTAALPR
ncbi:alkaline phosphatase family protein [Pseudonocardia sp.]|uniref:alkaline phosphatase family protein n=1 Tax=Pseudonocardia sp. TaxID=60912 RepID=UPI0039C8D872